MGGLAVVVLGCLVDVVGVIDSRTSVQRFCFDWRRHLMLLTITVLFSTRQSHFQKPSNSIMSNFKNMFELISRSKTQNELSGN
jgi:hypothetical protein